MKYFRSIFVVLLSVIFIGSFLFINGCKKKEPETMKIGAILPLTGPASSFGQYVKEGIDLAVEEVNRESSIKFSIYYEDSKNQPKEAVSAYNKIVSLEKVPVVITALSSVASALSPLASKTKTVQIYVDVAKPNVADGNYSFRIYPEANGTSGVLSKFAAKQLLAKTAAVIHINDDYGIASLDVFKKSFASYGGQVVFSETYELLQRDFRPQMIKLKNIGPTPDVIYLNGYGPSFVSLIRQLKESKIKSKLVADVALGLPENLDQAGNAAEGAYFVDGKITPGFVEKFEQRYKKKPSSDAGYAYDIMKILYSVVKKKGKFSNTSVQEIFLNLKDFPGVMGKISMKSNGDADLEFVVNQVRNGRPIVVEE